LAFFFLLSPHVAHAAESEFEVVGDLNIESLTADSKVRHSQSCKFTVAVSGARWLIKIVYAQNHFEVYGCDGTNVYSFLGDERSSDVAAFPGKVTSGSYPDLATYHVTIPWYAFVFAPFPNKPSNARTPAPWYFGGTDPLANLFAIETTPIRDGSELCGEILFRFSHELAKQPSTNLVPIRAVNGVPATDIISLKDQIPDRQITAVFKTLDLTNYNGILIPKRFEFTYFNDRSFKSNSRSRIHFSGELSGVRNLTTNNFFPQTTKTIDVADYRFHDRVAQLACIHYDVIDGDWLEAHNPQLKELLKAGTIQQKGTIWNHKVFLMSIRLLFVCAVVLPVLVFLIMVKNKSKRRKVMI